MGKKTKASPFFLYYRTITDLFPKANTETFIFLKNEKFLRHLFLFLFIVQAIFLVGYYLLSNIYVKQVIEHEQLEREYKYWSVNAERHQNSAEVLFNASYFAAKLGERNDALYYIELALENDPFFTQAVTLREELVL